MSTRIWHLLVVTSLVVGISITTVVLLAEPQSVSPRTGTATLPDATSVKAFIAAQVTKGFTPPKTPWGDPDISGVFTTKNEANTPLERPAYWSGRRMQDITPQELAADMVERQRLAIERAPFAGGGEPEEGVAIAVPIHWFDNLAAVNSRPWFMIEPPDGQLPSLTATAEKRTIFRPGLENGRRDTYLDRNLGDRCIAMGAFRQPGIYGNSFQIVQAPGYVVLRQEQVHEARVVPLDDREPLSPHIRSYIGHTRGYWEQNTLVVVTTNFDPRMEIRNFGAKQAGYLPLGNLRLIERYTRIAPDKVEWTMTFDDPTTWTQPFTVSFPMTADNTQIIHEYACHEGNFGLANLLSAGRLGDKQTGKSK